MSRQVTPDILDNLQGNTEIREESNVSIKSKKRATFNLELRTIDSLERAWLKLRQSHPKRQISKSDIAEKALIKTLSDIHATGMFS